MARQEGVLREGYRIAQENNSGMIKIIKSGTCNNRNYYDILRNGENIGELSYERRAGSGREFSGYVGYMPTSYSWVLYMENGIPGDRWNSKEFNSFKEAKEFIETMES